MFTSDCGIFKPITGDNLPGRDGPDRSFLQSQRPAEDRHQQEHPRCRKVALRISGGGTPYRARLGWGFTAYFKIFSMVSHLSRNGPRSFSCMAEWRESHFFGRMPLCFSRYAL